MALPHATFQVINTKEISGTMMTNSFSLKAQCFWSIPQLHWMFWIKSAENSIGFYHQLVWHLDPKVDRNFTVDRRRRCWFQVQNESNDSREVWNSMANNKSQVEGFEGMDKAPIFVGIREYLCKDIPWDLEFTSFGAQSHSKKRTDMVPQLY